MRKMLICGLLCMFCTGTIALYAREDGAKGASAKAYEHASENSIFNRVSDWFATIGKSEEEKEMILIERKAKRAAEKAKKKAEKAKKEAGKTAEKTKKKMKEGADSFMDQ